MSGTVLYRKHGDGERISAIRINSREASLSYWAGIRGCEPVELRERLKTMTPYDAVYEGINRTQPANAWPVPGRPNGMG